MVIWNIVQRACAEVGLQTYVLCYCYLLVCCCVVKRMILCTSVVQGNPTRQWHRGKGVLERNQGSQNHAEQEKTTRVILCRGGS